MSRNDTSPAYTILQQYNVLDCCNTLELLEPLIPQLDPERARTYNLSKALQAPILSMTLRGIRLDLVAMGEERERLTQQLSHVRSQLSYIVHALTGRDFNPGSVPQLRQFLFTSLGAKPVIMSKKGERKILTDREGLEKMMENEPVLVPFIELLLLYRDIQKTLSVLKTGLDADGRIRSYFSITGTTTGRLSSSENAFGRGTNLQNITEELRRIFVADPGYVLCNIDLSQADSWNIAFETYRRTGDTAYLDAILSGDLHTFVTRLIWPDLPWTGDLKADRAIAERQFYRHWDYRFMSKKGGHGTNYYGKPYTLARQMKIPTHLAENFQRAYLTAFPALRPTQKDIIREVQLTSNLVTILGRKRYFHGRLREEATWREAIAYLGQSPTADVINTVMLSIHRTLPEVQFLAQIHDALLFQIPQHSANRLLPLISDLFIVPIRVTSPSGTTIEHHIPHDISVGWNWGKRWKKDNSGNKIEANPDGLDDWRGELDVKRTRKIKPEANILDTILS